MDNLADCVAKIEARASRLENELDAKIDAKKMLAEVYLEVAGIDDKSPMGGTGIFQPPPRGNMEGSHPATRERKDSIQAVPNPGGLMS